MAFGLLDNQLEQLQQFYYFLWCAHRRLAFITQDSVKQGYWYSKPMKDSLKITLHGSSVPTICSYRLSLKDLLIASQWRIAWKLLCMVVLFQLSALNRLSLKDLLIGLWNSLDMTTVHIKTSFCMWNGYYYNCFWMNIYYILIERPLSLIEQPDKSIKQLAYWFWEHKWLRCFALLKDIL